MKTQNVKSLTWTDSRFKELSRDGKLLWLYFMTSERSNMAGVFESSIVLICEETGLDSAKFSVALKELAINFMAWHFDKHIILKNRWQYNNLENSKIVKGISNTIVDIPDSVKKFILELDNELTWAIDTVFNVDLKLSKKERYYQSHAQKHTSSHAGKADPSHLNLNLDSNLNSNPHLNEGWSDDFSAIFDDIEKEYGLMKSDLNKIKAIAKTESGREEISIIYKKITLNDEIDDIGAYLITCLKGGKK